ncbi:hypothetical protein FJY63_09695 [Candidatus Sumerlaeota bacterium]|nr:hypothetical protein [Candidatus Sumerlaeota bacterium]
MLNARHERNILLDRVESRKAEKKELERRKRLLEQGKIEEWVREASPGTVFDGERSITLRKSDEKPTSSTSTSNQKSVDTNRPHAK